MRPRLRPLSVVAFVATLSTWQASRAADSDDVAIAAILARNDAGYRDFNAELAAGDYADDADWTNAFGVSRTGRVLILAYLAELFARPEFRRRASIAPAAYTTKFVRPDVAVVHRFIEVAGQRGANNTALPNRRIHRLIVLTKEAGTWRMASELVMDERQ